MKSQLTGESIRRGDLTVGEPTWQRLDLSATIRYDTRCYFNVRTKANMSQLNLPHGNDNQKVKYGKTKK